MCIKDTTLNIYLHVANENAKAKTFIMENTLTPHLFITFHSLLKISKVHVSLFISWSPLPFLRHPYGTVSLHTETTVRNWASSTPRVLASDTRPINQAHLVTLSQAITVPPAG